MSTKPNPTESQFEDYIASAERQFGTPAIIYSIRQICNRSS